MASFVFLVTNSSPNLVKQGNYHSHISNCSISHSATLFISLVKGFSNAERPNQIKSNQSPTEVGFNGSRASRLFHGPEVHPVAGPGRFIGLCWQGDDMSPESWTNVQVSL